MTRYYGDYANRVRGVRRRAELLRQIFAVDPLGCPRCGAVMRIVAFITQRAVIDRILDHLHRARDQTGDTARGQPRSSRRASARSTRHSA